MITKPKKDPFEGMRRSPDMLSLALPALNGHGWNIYEKREDPVGNEYYKYSRWQESVDWNPYEAKAVAE